MKPRLSRSLRRILAGVVVCSQLAQAENLDWNGTDGNHKWDATSPNWVDAGTTSPTVAFFPGDNVTFADAAEGDVATTVTMTSTPINAGRIVIDGDYTFETTEAGMLSGDIHGSGTLTKTGAAPLEIIATANEPDSELHLAVDEGELALGGNTTYNTADIASGADLLVEEQGDITFNSEVNGDTALNFGRLHLLGDSEVQTLAGPGTLVIGRAGSVDNTVDVATPSVLGRLENHGTLNAAQGLTLLNRTTQGGTVNTPSLGTTGSGNQFTAINTDKLQLADITQGEAVITTESIAPATEGKDIQVEMQSVNRRSPEYTLVEVTGDDSADTTYTLTPETVKLMNSVGLAPVTTTSGKGGFSIRFNRIPSRYYSAMASTPNGEAGATLVESAFLTRAPQWNRAGNGDMAAVMDTLDQFIERAAGTTPRAANDANAAASAYDNLAANVAGPGVACLGIAWRTSMERHMRAVRDRISVMKGGITCENRDPKAPHPRTSCFSMWLGADIDYQNQRANNIRPGYKLHGIGGTLGMSGRIGDHWILGGALSGMSGRISSKGYGADDSGDMDSYYGTIFARFDHGCWSHSFSGTFGWVDIDFDRRVYFPGGHYETNGSPNGLGLGAMYELSRTFRISENFLASAWWQPVLNASFIHSRVRAFTESGSDAALTVNKQEYNNAILGAGLRMQTVLGRRFLNRDSVFHMRVLAKGITGDRRGSADVSLAGGGRDVRVNTTKRSAMSLEVGGGLAIPFGYRGGNLYVDCTGDFGGHYRAVNGSAGYHIGF